MCAILKQEKHGLRKLSGLREENQSLGTLDCATRQYRQGADLKAVPPGALLSPGLISAFGPDAFFLAQRHHPQA